MSDTFAAPRRRLGCGAGSNTAGGLQKHGGTTTSATAWTHTASSLSAGRPSSASADVSTGALLARALVLSSASVMSSSAGARSALVATSEAALAAIAQKPRPCTSSSTYGVTCAP